MAEAGTWRDGRREAGATPAPRGAGLPAPRLGPALATHPFAPAAIAVVLAYAGFAAAGACAGVGLAAAVFALAGRTLFEMTAELAQLVLVAAPLLALLPPVIVLTGAAARPAWMPHLPRLLLLWLCPAALVAFWLGVRPFLR